MFMFRFRLQIRVQDSTGTCSLSLFNDEVQAIADRSAYQLCDKYGKVHSQAYTNLFYFIYFIYFLFCPKIK
jgi:hypothetical protein